MISVTLFGWNQPDQGNNSFGTHGPPGNRQTQTPVFSYCTPPCSAARSATARASTLSDSDSPIGPGHAQCKLACIQPVLRGNGIHADASRLSAPENAVQANVWREVLRFARSLKQSERCVDVCQIVFGSRVVAAHSVQWRRRFARASGEAQR